MSTICGLELFSGRPDPKWDIDNSLKERIILILDKLPQVPLEDLKSSPILGYRGAFMKFENKELFASQGKASFYENGKVTSSCLDKARELERAIAYSAPDSMDLPWEVINAELN